MRGKYIYSKVSKSGEKTSRYDFFPLILILLYLSATYIFHLLLNQNASLRTLLFIIVSHVSIFLGYMLPVTKRSDQSLTAWKYNGKIEKIIVICMWITIINCFNNIAAYYYGNENIFEYLINPGKAYEYVKLLRNNPEFNTSGRNLGSIIGIILTLLTFTKYIYLIFSILYWHFMKKRTKLLFCITTIIYIAQALLLGTMITIAELLMACTPLIIKYMRTSKIYSIDRDILKSPRRIKDRKFPTLIIIITIITLIAFFISNRIDDNSSLFVGFNSLAFYISHGYVGLEYAMKLPFKFTFGVTTFKGIASYLIEFLDIKDPFMNSYLMRNEYVYDWSATSVWSTAYPWLASDFTFFFIPLILLYISYKFSVVWNRTIKTDNPYGYLLLGQLFIFWFMIPANNQLFHTLGNSASFFTILMLYIHNIKKYRILK